MNQIIRFFFITASLLLVLSVGISPAFAAPNPLQGMWESTDVDGSYQILHIGGGPASTHQVRYYDYGASVCGVDPESGAILYAGWARGSLTRYNYVLAGTLPFYCRTSPPTFWGNVTFQFTYDPGTDTLTDGWGIVWTRK